MLKDLHSRKDWVLCVGIPVGFLLLTFMLEQFFDVGCFTACEDGPVEYLQSIVMFIAFGIGVYVLRAPRSAYPLWVRVWLLLGTMAALFIALEEISYGQRIFGWATPDSWDLVNDQQETNLHNTSSWLDQKPRAILEIGVFIGGIVIPALRCWKPKWLPQKWSDIYPENTLFVTALIAFLIRVWDSGTEWIGRQDLFLIDRGSELQESYFGWFILLYLLYMCRKYRSSK